MIKSLLIITLSFSLFLSSPLKANANKNIEVIENDFSNVLISVNESVLHVAGANGQMMQIYNIAGVCVMSFKIEGNDKRYELNLTKGIYIVKVGNVVRKIAVK